MKADNLRQVVPDVRWDYRFKTGLIIFLLLVLSDLRDVQAQCLYGSNIFTAGEKIEYDLYFKWGFIVPRAGLATLSMENGKYEGKSALHYNLLFRTSGMFDKIYRMRDTIECYFSPKMSLLYSSKRTNDGDYYLVENLKFSYKDNLVSAHNHRYTMSQTKIDTVLTDEACMFDMLAATLYLRDIDWTNLKFGEEFPFKIAIGRDVVNASFRYMGQAIVEHKSNIKYSTRRFYIDVYDEAFTQSKEAAEIWIGDDANHIPVKIRARLKIGAVEVYYKSSEGLRYPLTCRVVVPKR